MILTAGSATQEIYAEMYAAWTEHLVGHDDVADSGEMVAAPSTG